jgi:hypothetical protein
LQSSAYGAKWFEAQFRAVGLLCEQDCALREGSTSAPWQHKRTKPSVVSPIAGAQVGLAPLFGYVFTLKISSLLLAPRLLTQTAKSDSN